MAIKEREILIALYLIIGALLIFGYGLISKYLLIAGVVLGISWVLLLKYYTNLLFVRIFLLAGIALSAVYCLGIFGSLLGLTAIAGIPLNIIAGAVVGISGIMLIQKFGLV